MEKNKTRLQLEVEKAQAHLARVIVEEIENGEIATPCIAGVHFEDVLLIDNKPHHSAAIVIYVDAPEIDEFFKPSFELLKLQKEALQFPISRKEWKRALQIMIKKSQKQRLRQMRFLRE